MSRLQKKVDLFILLLIAMACHDVAEPDQERLGFGFFPIREGLYWEYEVNTIQYLNTGGTEESTHYYRFEVADSFPVNANGQQYAYVIYRSRKEQLNHDWKADATLSWERNQHTMIWIEDNTPYIKLSFPPQEHKIWDGNARNTLERNDYRMQNVYHEFVISNDTFPQTITVIQADNQDSIISLDRRMEVFAKDVGLVFKTFSQIDFCNETNCLGLGIIDFGISFSWQLKAFGKLED